MDLTLHIAAGAAVGFAIGLTGVGGGSLMTPLLLFFGYPAPVAVGTDLLYAAITKSGGALSHHRAGNVDWLIVRLLALGSIPTALLVHGAISQTTLEQSPEFEQLLTSSLGIMLIITSIILILNGNLKKCEGEQARKADGFCLQASKPSDRSYGDCAWGLCDAVIGRRRRLCSGYPFNHLRKGFDSKGDRQ